MSRTMKLRAWIPSLKFMGTPFDLKEELRCGQSEVGTFPLDSIFLEWTGVEDVDKMDIYENDIIEMSTGEFALIVWRKDLASFAIRKNDWLHDHYFGEAVDPARCKVIGNYYQNPELVGKLIGL